MNELYEELLVLLVLPQVEAAAPPALVPLQLGGFFLFQLLCQVVWVTAVPQASLIGGADGYSDASIRAFETNF